MTSSNPVAVNYVVQSLDEAIQRFAAPEDVPEEKKEEERKEETVEESKKPEEVVEEDKPTVTKRVIRVKKAKDNEE